MGRSPRAPYAASSPISSLMLRWAVFPGTWDCAGTLVTPTQASSGFSPWLSPKCFLHRPTPNPEKSLSNLLSNVHQTPAHVPRAPSCLSICLPAGLCAGACRLSKHTWCAHTSAQPCFERALPGGQKCGEQMSEVTHHLLFTGVAHSPGWGRCPCVWRLSTANAVSIQEVVPAISLEIGP